MVSTKLNWACQVIQGSRTILRRMIDITNGYKCKNDKVILTVEFRKDLHWWIPFIGSFNGTVRFLDPRPIRNIMTDACNSGGGAYFNGDYYYVHWKTDSHEAVPQHINVKETLAIILALKRWAGCHSDARVIIYTDNVTAKSYIIKGSCKNVFVMEQLRQMFWCQTTYNFSVYAKFVPGTYNLLADTGSRLSESDMFTKLYSLLPCESLGLKPFSRGELAKHMSLAFIYCRWGRASTNTGLHSETIGK